MGVLAPALFGVLAPPRGVRVPVEDGVERPFTFHSLVGAPLPTRPLLRPLTGVELVALAEADGAGLFLFLSAAEVLE